MHCPQLDHELGYTFNRGEITEDIKKNIQKLEIEEKNHQEDSGSDSDPDGDLFDIDERLNTLKMKTLLKT